MGYFETDSGEANLALGEKGKFFLAGMDFSVLARKKNQSLMSNLLRYLKKRSLPL